MFLIATNLHGCVRFTNDTFKVYGKLQAKRLFYYLLHPITLPLFLFPFAKQW